MPRRTSGDADAPLDGREHGEQRHSASQNRGRLLPRDVRQAHDAEDEQQHCGGQADRSADVEAAPAQWRGLVVRQEAQGDREQPDGEQHGGEEDPAPVDRGEQATGNHAQGEAAGRRAAVDEQRTVAGLTFFEVGRDDRQAGRREETGADAGGEAGEDQHPSFGRQSAEAGEGDEHHQSGQEHASPTEEVGGTPTQQHEAAIAEHVCADDPLQRRRRQVQVGADRRQGDAHHRHVEAFQEDGPAQHEEHGPRPPAEAGRAGPCRERRDAWRCRSWVSSQHPGASG